MTPPVDPTALTHYHRIAMALDNAVANGCADQLARMSPEDIAYDLARLDAGCERLDIEVIIAGVRAWLHPQAKHSCVDPRHRWPEDAEDGDTCECGAWYRFRDHIERAPEPSR